MSRALSLPLYRGHGLQWERPADGNAGLWFNKMVAMGPPPSAQPGQSRTRDNGEAQAKHEWFALMTAAAAGGAGPVREAVQRRQTLVGALGGNTWVLRTAGRLVTGLGLPHPFETGFAWHHSLGVPYLPGSSLKGVARDWAQQWAGEHAAAQRICGPEGQEERAVGTVVFFDALPTGPVRLDTDVMTPHYSEYYQDGTDQKPPADWYSPVPIPFLTVAAGQSFLFAVAPRTPAAGEDAARAAEWLRTALTGVGAGAKTAAGYGRFEQAPAPVGR